MLNEKIESDLKTALLARDEVRVSTLRFLKAALHNLEIEKRVKVLDDADICKVIQKQVKQRQESIESFEAGTRPDLAAKEKAELAILQSYLPKALSDDELRKAVENAIRKTGATKKAQMGAVMKEVMAQVGGRADGKLVSALVSAQLP